jgi:hypothetical protein
MPLPKGVEIGVDILHWARTSKCVLESSRRIWFYGRSLLPQTVVN